MAKPICFMIMPFKTKSTGNAAGLPAEIDFDALWNNALAPAIEQLGYKPVRADQDLGALIIPEMLERLALSDLVLADLTIPNGNVYYEVGIRHAAGRAGCVLLAADRAKPLFDVEMRQIRYPLPEGQILPETAEGIKKAVIAGVPALQEGISPVFQALPGYPNNVAADRATSLRELVDGLGEFRAELLAVSRAPVDQRKARALKLRDQYAGSPAMLPIIALELMYLLANHTDWQTTLDYIEALPKNIRTLAPVKEQRTLAKAKLGDELGAIGEFEQLIELLGDTSDRQGMIGGRYKSLYDKAVKAGKADDAADFLNRAIEHYEQGMRLDLNDYYPSSNLPRLLRLRDQEGDAVRAAQVTVIAFEACQRAKARNPNDAWVRSTLLALAIDSGDANMANAAWTEVKREGPSKFKLATTLADLERSLMRLPEKDEFRIKNLEKVQEYQTKLAGGES